jgi:transposase
LATVALHDAVLALLGVVKAVNTAVKDLDKSVAARLGEHPDGQIFTSLPRSVQINAAQMLAEWGDCRQAYETPDSIAALAGCTPVTRPPANTKPSTSGGPITSGFAWPSPPTLTTADTPAAGRRRSATTPAQPVRPLHAVRILAHAWIRVIWRCWHDNTPYEPSRHEAAHALAAQSSVDLAA